MGFCRVWSCPAACSLFVFGGGVLLVVSSARAAADEVGLSIEDRKYGLHVMYQHYDMMEPRGMLF